MWHWVLGRCVLSAPWSRSIRSCNLTKGSRTSVAGEVAKQIRKSRRCERIHRIQCTHSSTCRQGHSVKDIQGPAYLTRLVLGVCWILHFIAVYLFKLCPNINMLTHMCIIYLCILMCDDVCMHSRYMIYVIIITHMYFWNITIYNSRLQIYGGWFIEIPLCAIGHSSPIKIYFGESFASPGFIFRGVAITHFCAVGYWDALKQHANGNYVSDPGDSQG